MSEDLLPNIVGMTLLAAGAVGSGWIGMRRLAQARLIGDTPTSRIRSAAQGFVELKGVLVQLPAGLIEAPLTGLPCVWWSFRIEKYTSNGKNSSWKTVESGRSEQMLILRDETGDCLISPAGAEVHPASKDVWRGNQRHPRRSTHHKGLLSAFMESGSYRYTEHRLHAGEALYALGDFRTSGGGRDGLDLASGQRAVIREWKEDFKGLLGRFDRNGDGQLDQAEWERVRHAANREAELRHRKRSQEIPELNTLRRPKEEYPFILSAVGESSLARKLSWQGGGLLLLCLLLTAATVWAAIRLGWVPAS